MSTAIDAFKYEQSLRAKGIPANRPLRCCSLAGCRTRFRAVTKAELGAEPESLIMWLIGTQFAFAALIITVLRFTGHT
jgi:hypothetical protein